jgi:hypothetical protein
VAAVDALCYDPAPMLLQGNNLQLAETVVTLSSWSQSCFNGVVYIKEYV